MGWTSFKINTTATTDEILRREMTQDDQQGARDGWAVMQSATVGAQWFAIMRRTYHDTSTPDGSTAQRVTYYGLICLTQRRTIKGTGQTEFFYKDMDESCGPYAYAMPVRMLNELERLAPSPEGYAAKWREGVRMHHARKAAKAKAKREARAKLARFISDHFQIIHVTG
jgi:hypothetical protein